MRAEGAVLVTHLTSDSLFFLICVKTCREHPCYDVGGERRCRSPRHPKAGTGPAVGKELGDLRRAVHRAVMLGSSRSGTRASDCLGNPLRAGPYSWFLPWAWPISSPEWELPDEHLTTGVACSVGFFSTPPDYLWSNLKTTYGC